MLIIVIVAYYEWLAWFRFVFLLSFIELFQFQFSIVNFSTHVLLASWSAWPFGWQAWASVVNHRCGSMSLSGMFVFQVPASGQCFPAIFSPSPRSKQLSITCCNGDAVPSLLEDLASSGWRPMLRFVLLLLHPKVPWLPVQGCSFVHVSRLQVWLHSGVCE
jgi:hypothetical protein